MRSINAGNIIENIGTPPILFVSEFHYVHQALIHLANHSSGAILVKRADKIVGIFSERDYARKVLLKGKTSKNIFVSEIMTRKVIFVNYDTCSEECLSTMIRNDIRHLPVFKNQSCIGFISIFEVVKHLLEHREFLIDQMNKFISGSLTTKLPITKTVNWKEVG